MSAFLESILRLNPYKCTVFLAETIIFFATMRCNGSCCGECREKGNTVLHLPWDFKIRGYEDSKSNRVLWDFVCLFVCSLCFCVPSGLTWADSCCYLACISSHAFRVNLSHSMCEKALQGYHAPVNGSQGWNLSTPEGIHVKVRAKRKYSFNWASQISPQPSKSKGKEKSPRPGKVTGSQSTSCLEFSQKSMQAAA